MTQRLDLVMPINERYGLQIVHGIKRFEIRTKPLWFPAGTRVWIYASASTTTSGVGAILGSFTYGGCYRIPGPRALRAIALEAAASEDALGTYIAGRWPAWALRVQSYERLRVPFPITIPGQGIRRFRDQRLLETLEAAEALRPRRPLSRAAMEERRKLHGYSVNV